MHENSTTVVRGRVLKLYVTQVLRNYVPVVMRMRTYGATYLISLSMTSGYLTIKTLTTKVGKNLN